MRSSAKLKIRNPWVVVLSASLFFVFEFFQSNMFNVLEPHIMQEFNISSTHLSFLASFHLWGTVLFLLPAGLLVDRLSVRKLILVAMGSSILFTVAFSQTHSFQLASLFRLLVGVCAGPFCVVSAMKLSSQWFPLNRLSFVTGCIVSMGMLGAVCAQIPMLWLVTHYGWRSAILVDAGIGALLWAIIYLNVYDKPDPKAALDRTPLAIRLKQVVSLFDNWKAVLCASAMNLPIPIFGSLFANLFLNERYGFSRDVAAGISSMLFIGMIVGSPLMGWLSGQWQSRKKPMMLGAVTSLVVLLGVLLGDHCASWVMATAFFVLGVGVSGHTLVYPYLAETNAPQLTATAIALAGVALIGGGAIAQPAVGYFIDVVRSASISSANDFVVPFALLPAAQLLAVLIIFFMKESFGGRR
ncbi:MAG: MFS transporter [Pseudomonadota bacterium]